MISREKAIALRKLIEKLSADLSDSEAYTAPELFPAWTIKDYQTGDRVQYQGILYKCLQSHTAQSDWTPDTAVSLWVMVDDPSIEFPEWHQPQGSHDAYSKGAKVSWPKNERKWISDVDGNVWEPGAAGTEALWHDV